MNANAFPAIFYGLMERMHLPSPPSDEERIRIPEIIGQGSIERIRLRNGIEIHTWDFQLEETDAVEFTSSSSFIDLNFLLHGHFDYSVDGVRQQAVVNFNQLTSKNQRKRIKYVAGVQVTFLKIRIPPPIFEELLQQLSSDLSLDVGFVDAMHGGSYCQEALDPAVQIILWQMLRCPYPRGIRSMYMEAKVTELLAIYFLSLLRPSTSDSIGKPSILRGDDTVKLHAVQRLLLQNMENPPTLMEIAKEVGLNDFKLKAGFKEMFGTTVFGYLREKRLERALYLLQQGQLNITEVAYAVGYSNPGYFAAAFKEKYGVKPSQLLKTQHV